MSDMTNHLCAICHNERQGVRLCVGPGGNKVICQDCIDWLGWLIEKQLLQRINRASHPLAPPKKEPQP